METTTIGTRQGGNRVVGFDEDLGRLLLRDDVVTLPLALGGKIVGDHAVARL